MNHHTVIVDIGLREFRKFPVALNPEPQIGSTFVVGGKALKVLGVNGFDVRLSSVPDDPEFCQVADKEGFYHFRF